MSRDASKRPEPTAPQSVPERIEAAPESIEVILTPAILTAPVGGSLELGSDGQYRYRPRRRYCIPAANVIEHVAVN
jgi:hypothetical protein